MDDEHDAVVVEYDLDACAGLVDGLAAVRAYFVANWGIDPDYAVALADQLHDIMFSPPTDDELAGSPAAPTGLDLGATAVALRRALAQPTGAPVPLFRPRDVVR